LDNRVLQLIIMPTEACNFRCIYCYEEFKLKRMEPKVVQGVMNFLDRRAPNLGCLDLSWFGGEPLLARDIIEEILEHVSLLRRKYQELQFFSHISTNAFLLSRSLFERLLQLGVTQYQITFDGPREYHDKKRLLAGGGGTFEKLWQNLVALRDVRGEFTILVRLHIDKDNLESLPTFVREFGAMFGQDSRFKLFFRQLSHMGGPNDHQLSILDAQGCEQAVRTLSRYARQIGVEHITTHEMAAICYAARGNSFVVRADGRLNKCSLALEHPENQVGRILEDGTLELAVPKMRMWMRGLESGKVAELECPLHGYG
jgi:uncharacterized protein